MVYILDLRRVSFSRFSFVLGVFFIYFVREFCDGIYVWGIFLVSVFLKYCFIGVVLGIKFSFFVFCEK